MQDITKIRRLKHSSHNFDVTDLESLLGIDSIKSTVSNTQELIANSNQAAKQIAPAIAFISKYWIPILFAYVVLLIVTSVIANKISK